MGRRLVDATNACFNRLTRGETAFFRVFELRALEEPAGFFATGL
jgi:hypothetical protein